MNNLEKFSLKEACEVLNENYKTIIILCDEFEDFLSIKDNLIDTKLTLEDIKILQFIRYLINHKDMNFKKIKSLLRKKNSEKFRCDFISQIIMNELDDDITIRANNLYVSNQKPADSADEQNDVQKRDERFIKFVQEYRSANKSRKDMAKRNTGLLKKIRCILNQNY